MSNHSIASWIWAQRTGSIRKLFCEQKFLMKFYTEDKKKSRKLRFLPNLLVRLPGKVGYSRVGKSLPILIVFS